MMQRMFEGEQPRQQVLRSSHQHQTTHLLMRPNNLSYDITYRISLSLSLSLSTEQLLDVFLASKATRRSSLLDAIVLTSKERCVDETLELPGTNLNQTTDAGHRW